MNTSLVYASQHSDTPTLLADLRAVGIPFAEVQDCAFLVQEVGRIAPEVIILSDAHPDPDLFESIRAVADNSPRPLVLFTTDPDAEKIDQAMQAGVHAYVVNGYSRARLRSVIHLAQSRFRHEQMLRGELNEISQRFNERKLVDRAKGILMGARQLREEEAYSALRSAAMRSKRRIGQVSRQVIDGARYAEAVNRAGQLRMLSQRLAKLYALLCTGTRPHESAGLFADSIALVDANLAVLSRSLSKPTFGDLLDGVQRPWNDLKPILASPTDPARLPAIDRAAEDLLDGAEVLTANLEVAGYAAALHVINVAGRQRMLSQRLAKQALLSILLPDLLPDQEAPQGATMAVTVTAIEASLDYLSQLPMTNPAIARELETSRVEWTAMRAALSGAATPSGQDAVAETSETLLAAFERLTDQLERGIQAMVV